MVLSEARRLTTPARRFFRRFDADFPGAAFSFASLRFLSPAALLPPIFSLYALLARKQRNELPLL